MMMTQSHAPSAPMEPKRPTRTFTVFRCGGFPVISGVNLGEAFFQSQDVALADIYHLTKTAQSKQLTIEIGDQHLWVTNNSVVGRPGAHVHLDCVATFMDAAGGTVEVLVFVETDADGMIEDSYLMPFAPLSADMDYTLVAVDRETARQRLNHIACAAFSRSTRITMANGLQKCVEQLVPGDWVQTRNHGPQQVRWIGHHTVRATGRFAPIVIKKGALNNENDLVISPDHRLFISQRADRLHAGKPEMLIEAKRLINGNSVVQATGGFIDYFQILFDHHEIIYAEGIASESMMVEPQWPTRQPDLMSPPTPPNAHLRSASRS